MSRRALTLLALLVACAPSSNDFDGDGIEDSQDCAPEDAAVYPGAADPWGDGADTNCDDVDGTDADGDGYPVDADADGTDCDDTDPGVHPDALEVPANAVDEDCDGEIDRDRDGTDDREDCAPTDPLLDAEDRDGDGSTTCDGDCDDADATRESLDVDGDGSTTCDGDCDDEDSSRSPLLVEQCDGLDTSCLGGVPAAEQDGDGDGIAPCAGDCDDSDPALHSDDADGDGASPCAGDCDDGDPAIGPGSAELCDGADQDCDGAIPGEADLDGDGQRPCGGDCDDGDADLHALDSDSDGVDACAGDCDDSDPAVLPLDADGDGSVVCGGVGDCDDSDPAVAPGAAEACDGGDSDCDGLLPPAEQDQDGDGQSGCAGDCDDVDPSVDALDGDGDGFSSCAGDCDDGEAAVRPLAVEQACDGVDSDCVPDPSEVDGDGDGTFPCAGDCDDGDAAVGPGGVERCNQRDDDCDGAVPASEFDGDGDRWVPCTPWLGEASLADGGGDCDDGEAASWPGAAEYCDGLDQDCDGAVDEGFDVDGDGLAECLGDCDDADPAVQAGLWEDPRDGFDSDCDGRDPAFIGHARSVLASPPSALNLFGAAMVAVADLDGDGVDEVAVGGADGAAGRTRASIFSGAALLAGLDGGPGDAAIHIDGDTPFDGFGAKLARVPDLDGDGLDELLVSAPEASGQAGSAGVVYLILGADLGAGTASGLATARVLGTTLLERVGAELAVLGDLDGDGLAECAVSDGAIADATPQQSWVYSGADLLAGGDLTAADALVHVQGSDRAHSAGALRPGPDLDGDGQPELWLGDTHGTRFNGVWPSTSFPTAGSVASSSAPLQLDMGYLQERRLPGGERERLGRAVLGDLDGDGADEVVLTYGLVGSAPSGSLGRAWLLRGGDLVSGVVDVDAMAELVLDGEGGWGLGISVVGCDVDGDGRDELLLGSLNGADEDPLVGNEGSVWLIDDADLLGSGSVVVDAVALAAWTGGSGIELAGTALWCLGDLDGDGVEEWGTRKRFGLTDPAVYLFSGAP